MAQLMKNIYFAWQDTNNMKAMADQICERYSDHLRSGAWSLCVENKAILYRSSEESRRSLKEIREKQMASTSHASAARSRLQSVLCRNWSFRKKSEADGFQSDLVLVSNTGDIQFFDFKNRIVKKVYVSTDVIEKYKELESSGYWTHFSSPVIRCDKYYTVENMVTDENPDAVDIREKYRCILQKYYGYLSLVRVSEKRKLNDFIQGDYAGNEPLMKILTSVREPVSVPCCRLHGDFQMGNVFFTPNNSIEVVDCELSDEFPFFYDVVVWSLVYIYMKNDWRWLDLLLDGNTETAEMFEKILDLACLPKTKEMKLSIVAVTAVMKYEIEMGYHRWSSDKPDVYFRNLMNVINGLALK